MFAMNVDTFSRCPASHARSRAMTSSAVSPLAAPTSTRVRSSGLFAGSKTTASGPRERSSSRVFAPRSSNSRFAPEERFSTNAFAYVPPESSTVARPEESSARSRIGANFFASKKRRTAKEEPSPRVAFVEVGSRETSSVQ